MIDKIKKYAMITDIAEKFNIGMVEASVGNFTHRCKCPHPDHKNGSERTGSCYVDAEKNNFYCFGCQAGSSSIDFYMACANLDFSSAIDCMRPMVDGIKGDVEYKSKASNYLILLEISDLFKDKLKENPFCLDELKVVMKKTDEYIDKIKPSDVKRARFLRYKVEEKLKEL